MSHRWPAVRLGGAQPPRPRKVLVSVKMADVAASVTIVVTAPSGAETVFACSSDPCEITVDDRQGTHLYRIQYSSSSGKVLNQSRTDLVPSR